MHQKIDPITLAVVRGVLETTQREMTMTLEKTARSSVFNVAHDYSNAIFNHRPEMILQGQDIPIHLGGLIPAMKCVAAYFGDDIHDGDIIYHNDPAYMGSHIVDCCMYKPVFYKGELVFWTVCKGHVTDIGGPVPAGYNPDAKEIYAEGLRIPPIKLWDKGVARNDVINFMLTNMRSRRDQEGDLRAQLGAVNVGARNLIALLDKYGIGTFVWSTVLAYDADKLKTAPTGWADFWNVKKIPGKRAMRKGARYNLEFALMADGVPTKDVYKVLATKAGVERAFKKLDELKPNIQWWEAGAQPPQFLVAGDVVMTTAYNGRIDSAQREGKNLQVVWAGSIYDLDYWSIPKGSKNKAVAEKFIAYASSPEAQKNYATNIAYGPVNNNALKMLDAKTLAGLPTSAKNAKDAVGNNLKFWTDHGEDLEQRFTAWAAK